MEWLPGLVPLVALLCPLMMLLMMRGMHGGHGGHGQHDSGQTTSADADELTRLRDELAALRKQDGRGS
jgi:hypothetical protein